jgi:prohead core protein protease
VSNKNGLGDLIGCIICEETRTDIEFKITGENKNGFVIAEGILQEADEINRNRRYYPVEEITAAIMNPRQQELVSTGNFKGEAGHPLDKSLARQQKIDPQCEQIWYTKLWMDGPYVMGHFRGTNNDLGRSLNDDLKDGQKPSVSLRALGSLLNENGRATVRNMQIVTYDRVYFPSHSKAYMTKLVTTESAGSDGIKKYIIDEGSNMFSKQKEVDFLSEHGNSVDTNDNFIVPLTQNEINNFILSESSNIRSVLNSFDIFYESMEYDPYNRTVSMKTRLGDTIHLNLETAVSREIMNGISDLF